MSEGTSKKEEKPRKFQAIRGTRDLLPPGTALWNHVEATARSVFATFGFGEIRLPIFEPTELFARAVGGDTDIVSKEMYTFPDGPANLPDPVDPFQIGPFVRSIGESYSKGEIPQTESNENALEDLEKAFEEFAEETRKHPVSLSVGTPNLDLYLAKFYKVVFCANKVNRGDLVSLRPEATASVCRAYIEHGMQQLPQPVKLYYMGPMFRRERPQKGRYRQFYQIGAEVLGGSDAPAIDAEVIEMVMAFFDKLELRGVQLDINSIGCRDCRPRYVELLRAELLKVKDRLGADSQRRIETNPLRVLDSKLEKEQTVIATLPKIADHLCEACAAHYAAVKRNLALRGVLFRENWRLVRGLDYYMRTTFEITAQGLGSQNAVCGGGRYDGLVELLGGPPTKGIGFAIGEDRLILSLQESVKTPESSPHSPLVTRHSPLIFIAWMGEHAYAAAVHAARDLRRAGISVELPPTELKFGKALGQADKLGAKYALILGDNEVSEGLWTLKNLSDGSQQKFPEPALLDFLKKL